MFLLWLTACSRKNTWIFLTIPVSTFGYSNIGSKSETVEVAPQSEGARNTRMRRTPRAYTGWLYSCQTRDRMSSLIWQQASLTSWRARGLPCQERTHTSAPPHPSTPHGKVRIWQEVEFQREYHSVVSTWWFADFHFVYPPCVSSSVQSGSSRYKKWIWISYFNPNVLICSNFTSVVPLLTMMSGHSERG